MDKPTSRGKIISRFILIIWFVAIVLVVIWLLYRPIQKTSEEGTSEIPLISESPWSQDAPILEGKIIEGPIQIAKGIGIIRVSTENGPFGAIVLLKNNFAVGDKVKIFHREVFNNIAIRYTLIRIAEKME